MAITNRERVDKALELLQKGLGPYVKREVQAKSKRVSMENIRRYSEDPRLANKPIEEWDVAGLLRLMKDIWNDVFSDTLGGSGRNLTFELHDLRNKWAHQERFSSDDTDRALDSVQRLLESVSAEESTEVSRMKMDLRSAVYNEHIRNQKRRSTTRPLETGEIAGLRAWRDVVEPHEDVANGRYKQAEFAADLGQVHRGEGVDEYRDPVEFFRRTYLSISLKDLLVNAIRRLAGVDGDPVIQLQTNFGGGKTHSMLALYHLFSGIRPQLVPGLDVVLEEAEVDHVEAVNRVVLVGTQISPGSPSEKTDGTVVNTLWGELAYQLGGIDAYERLRVDDERATNPGEKLRLLLVDYGPCVILIDEWVSYARQLHDEPGLPGGTFETQFTFAQTLSEAVKLTNNCLLMVSLPASDQYSQGINLQDGIEDSEVGGIRGHDALERLRNVVARVETPWRTVTAEEGFEIVRRRLFKPLDHQEASKQRDLTAAAFVEMYRTNRAEFPSECASVDYERRIQASYPIHPEVFDRLYEDWSSLARFQRTRGVLRLMATVIHSLWESDDRSPLIQPWNFNLNETHVRNELTRYLADTWMPVIQKDIDGGDALPRVIDREAPNLGKIRATTRVARAIYIGSAPIADAARRGIEDTRIRLGCVLPRESPAVFGDALRRLSSRATYLYQDSSRYWYDTQPTVSKIAADRAAELQRRPADVSALLEKRLRENLRVRGVFNRVHVCPSSPSDVPDEHDARLVVLPSEAPFARGEQSEAEESATKILQSRGTTPRLYQNSLVFLAADRSQLRDLDEALRLFIAWDSIVKDVKNLNLDPHQASQAEERRNASDDVVSARIPETYQWLLIPVQESASESMSWKPIRLASSGSLAERAGSRLVREELLIEELGPTILRMNLDEVPLWRGNHVEVQQLVEDFGKYLYLPRLLSSDILLKAIIDGVGLLTWEMDSFAFADAFDDEENRYKGLRYSANVVATRNSRSLVVKPSVARQQINSEEAQSEEDQSTTGTGETDSGELTDEDENQRVDPTRFFATVKLNPIRIGLEASQIGEEVLSHLNGLVGSKMNIALEIDVSVESGVPEDVERVVTENCASLRFESHVFEKD